MAYYGGIEGGATRSRMIILQENGTEVGFSEGPNTNYWHLGIDETARRIVTLVEEALINANLPKDTQLKSLGMALSGINTESNELQITAAVRRHSPNIAEKLLASNDAVGTLLTATDSSAVVLIAGTGSICKFIRTDMTYIRVGGLGYLLGDEGSAFWIANQAIMAYIKSAEGFYQSSFPMTNVAEAICKHFGVEHYRELLSFFHESINKTFIAQLCRLIAEEAANGDLFCQQLFYDAGRHLGRHVSAAIRQANQESFVSPEGIDVICCGSVFKSWNLIESGFRYGLRPQYPGDCYQGRLRIQLLQKTAAIGAAIMAAKREYNLQLPRPKTVSTALCEIDLQEHTQHGSL